MAFAFNPIDFVLHVDKYIGELINQFGAFTYLILFFIIFLETGLVIAPFLPGDSLLFVIGAFAAAGYLNIVYLAILLTAAAILGDSLNYTIGRYFGVHVFEKSRFFKKEYLKKTEDFYKKYGAKTIVLARFVPIVRTFAPFVAGVGKMNYRTFFSYNIIGGIIWIALFLGAGYFFGGIPFVKDNLETVILLIIGVSVLPIIIEYWRARKQKHK